MRMRAVWASVMAACSVGCGGGEGGEAPKALFGAPVVTATAADAQGTLLSADFNADGKLDVGLSAHDPASGFDSFIIMLGNGDGTFRGAGTIAGVRSPTVVDVDGDGKSDLVYCAADNSVSLRKGNGDGTFGEPTSVAALPGTCLRIAAGDIDGDGRVDIVAQFGDPIFNHPYHVYTLRGSGGGTFAAPVHAYDRDAFANRVTSSDVDLDGRADIIDNWLAVFGFDGGGSEVRLSKGDGTLQAPFDVRSALPSQVNGGSTFSCCADVNGDGKPDGILQTFETHSSQITQDRPLWVLLGRGDGTFQSGAAVLHGRPGVWTWADFDRDGHIDIVVWYQQATNQPVLEGILFGRGDGSFEAPRAFTAPEATRVLAADFDNDGRADLVLLSSTPTGANLVVLPNRIDPIH